MTLPQIKELFFERLQGLYPETEVESFFYLILEHHLGIRRIDLALRPGLRARSLDTGEFEKSLNDLARHRPVQYILGQAEFAGMTFKVDESVLIPRPETEELVHWITETALHLTSPRILDIGTGSGCIPISLHKRIREAEVHALDISPGALEIARENARRLKAEVRFFQHDILGPEDLDLSYNVLVSNPPYVRKSERRMMRGNVLKYEPELALFVEDEDPLLFYRRIAQHAHRSLKPGGYLFFEINETLADTVVALLAEGPFTGIEVKKDIYGKDRMIRAIKK